jgi:hypothetical protein
MLSRDLLSKQWPAVGQTAIRERLIKIFASRGFGAKNGEKRLRLTRIGNGLAEAFPPDLLAALGCDGDWWLIRLLHKTPAIQPPIRYLMLAAFLELTLKDLFEPESSEIKTVLRRTIVCRNPVCPTVGEQTVDYVNSEFSNALGGTIDNYRCRSCEQLIARCGVGRERTWIRDLGTAWRSRLKDLWFDEDLSINQIARALQKSADCVSKQAIKLGLPKRRRQRPDSNRQFTLALNRRKLGRTPEIEKKRKQWLKLLAKNPLLNRRVLREKRPALSAWLSRYDGDWLFQNLPSKRRRPPSMTPSDWQSRDDEFTRKIEATSAKLRKGRHKNRTISPSTLARFVGCRGALLTYFDKLPRSRCALIESADTSISFGLRHLSRMAIAVFCRVEQPVNSLEAGSFRQSDVRIVWSDPFRKAEKCNRLAMAAF